MMPGHDRCPISMEKGLNTAEEELDIGYLKYFIQHRGI